MNCALIFAGGVGNRMNSKARPKQFLEIHGKPIVIHTIEHFENHSDIDAICLVCVEDWLGYMQKLLDKYNIQKVKWLLAGGETALDTQHRGLEMIYKDAAHTSEDIVLIHDAVRPLINEDVISDCITSVKKYGSAVTVAPAIETIIHTDDEGLVESTIPRTQCLLARAPQAFYVDNIVDVHRRSVGQGEHNYIDSVSMMLAYGHQVHTVTGPAENIKVTTPADFYICRALLDAKENSQIYGI